MDAIANAISPEDSEDTTKDDGIPKFAIIGQPNVGKSSLLNALIGEERTIVSDIAGTTRDTIHTHYKLFQKEFMLIDTAGIRKRVRKKMTWNFIQSSGLLKRWMKLMYVCWCLMLIKE